jgi:hypothetical protein
MFKNILFTWQLLTGVVFLTWAQPSKTGKYISSDYFSNLIPKAPETGTLGTFGNVPVNYYTGLPEVSIPLTTLSSRDLSLSVSLNYDASGVRTDEISGPSGLKWNLSAGGTITRQLNGLPDEDTDLGYLKYAASTNYWDTSIDESEWARRSEKNTHDTHPDEFFFNVNGRSIRFVLDRNGNAVTIPRQGITVAYTVTSGKINKFIITTEDGTIYEFGGDISAIEQRKIESLRVRLKLKWEPTWEMTGPTIYEYYRDYYTGGAYYSNTDFENTDKTIDWYNSKWYLKSITSPSSNDKITLNYQKKSDVKYVVKPTWVRIYPVTTTLSRYEIGSWVHPTYNDPNNTIRNSRPLLALREFQATTPGSAPSPIIEVDGQSYPANLIEQAWTDHYLRPEKYKVNPGGVLFHHTLISENTIALISIESISGNRLVFNNSAREDLPNSFKYDDVLLYNNQNALVKHISLNFATVSANEESDAFWLSEAIMMGTINNLVQPDATYPAHYARTYSESAIPNAQFRKYVFEGLKTYNYKRTFLEGIIDKTGGANQLLYSFHYKDRSLLKRRTTPASNEYGFSVKTPLVSSFEIKDGKNAYTKLGGPNSYGNDHDPLLGILESITYPTAGKTLFEYIANTGPQIRAIMDLSADGTIQNQKTIDYTNSSKKDGKYILVSYQEFDPEGDNGWIKYMVVSSAPQNSHPSSDAVVTNPFVRVFNGTLTDHKGYEEYRFTSTDDAAYRDVTSTIKANPDDVGENGVTYPAGVNTFIFPFPRALEKGHLRGLLKQHVVYAGTYPSSQITKKIDHEYVVDPNYTPSSVTGFAGGSFQWSSSTETPWYGGQETTEKWRYRFARYQIVGNWVTLAKTTVTVPSETNPSALLVSTTEYVTDMPSLQPEIITTYNNALPDQKHITKHFYPTNAIYSYSSTGGGTSNPSPEASAIRQLYLNNQLSTVIESQTWVTDGAVQKLINAIVYRYEKVGTPIQYVRPRSIWALNQPITDYQPADVVFSDGSFVMDTRMRQVHKFDLYDASNGNLLAQTSLDGITSKYLWGFNNTLVTGFTINPGAQQISYVYDHKPLIGITCITDPNGRKNYYDFDRMNRLKLVKDHDGNIINRYRYHYKNYTGLGLSIAGPTSVLSNTAVSFQATDNVDIGQTTCEWNFGDGTIIQGSTSVNYVYTTAGTYIVTVKKTNPEYGAVQTTPHVVVVYSPGVLTIDANGPTSIDLCSGPVSGLELQASSSGGCTNYELTWQYESASSPGLWISYANGTTANPPPGFGASIATYSVRCVGYNAACNETIYSNVLTLSTYRSNPNCGIFEEN